MQIYAARRSLRAAEYDGHHSRFMPARPVTLLSTRFFDPWDVTIYMLRMGVGGTWMAWAGHYVLCNSLLYSVADWLMRRLQSVQNATM